MSTLLASFALALTVSAQSAEAPAPAAVEPAAPVDDDTDRAPEKAERDAEAEAAPATADAAPEVDAAPPADATDGDDAADDDPGADITEPLLDGPAVPPEAPADVDADVPAPSWQSQTIPWVTVAAGALTIGIGLGLIAFGILPAMGFLAVQNGLVTEEQRIDDAPGDSLAAAQVLQQIAYEEHKDWMVWGGPMVFAGVIATVAGASLAAIGATDGFGLMGTGE